MAGPFVFWSLVNQYNWIAFGLVFLAGVTDFLDGYCARLFNQSSRWGMLFDPVADKIFILGLFLGFIATGQIPLYLAVLIITRDVVILVGAFYASHIRLKLDLTPLFISKLNTAFLMFLGAALIIFPLVPSGTLKVFVYGFQNLLIYATLVTTLLSGFAYARLFIKAYR